MKNYPMTDVRHINYAERGDLRQEKLRKVAFFLIVYLPTMTVLGGILLLGWSPL